MIQCQFCSRAFHFECIEEQLVCDTCDERVLWPKTGTEEYLDLLECVAPTFPTGDDLFIDLDGANLNIEYLDEHGFDTPIKVRNKDGLDLKVPHSEFSVDDVIRWARQIEKSARVRFFSPLVAPTIFSRRVQVRI